MGEERTGREEVVRARWARRGIDVKVLLLIVSIICGI